MIDSLTQLVISLSLSQSLSFVSFADHDLFCRAENQTLGKVELERDRATLGSMTLVYPIWSTQSVYSNVSTVAFLLLPLPKYHSCTNPEWSMRCCDSRSPSFAPVNRKCFDVACVWLHTSCPYSRGDNVGCYSSWLDIKMAHSCLRDPSQLVLTRVFSSHYDRPRKCDNVISSDLSSWLAMEITIMLVGKF
jgi:hypothetical protein